MQMIRNRLIPLLLGTALVLFGAGCSTMLTLQGGPAAYQSSIKPGDTVKITTMDGRKLEFEVSDVNANGISGEGQAVSYDSIASIQKQQFSFWRTAFLVGGIIAAGVLATGDGYDSDYDYGSGGGAGGGGGPYTYP